MESWVCLDPAPYLQESRAQNGPEKPGRLNLTDCLNMCILLFYPELLICYCRLCEAVLSNSHSFLCFSQAILQFLRFVGMTFVGYRGPEEHGSVIKCILLSSASVLKNVNVFNFLKM